jgi:DNA uptake protein ComE-like DNA-binding protein
MKKLTARALAAATALILGGPAFAADAPAAQDRVDVNTASKEELKTTLGVGEDEAQKIIDARPYYKKDDLKTKKVMSAGEFEKLQRLIESVC